MSPEQAEKIEVEFRVWKTWQTMIEQESSYPLQADLRFSREKIEKAVLEGGSRRYGLLFSLGSVEEKELGIFIGGDTSAALPLRPLQPGLLRIGSLGRQGILHELERKTESPPRTSHPNPLRHHRAFS